MIYGVDFLLTWTFICNKLFQHDMVSENYPLLTLWEKITGKKIALN